MRSLWFLVLPSLVVTFDKFKWKEGLAEMETEPDSSHSSFNPPFFWNLDLFQQAGLHDHGPAAYSHGSHLDIKDFEKEVDTVVVSEEELEGVKKLMLQKLELHEPADHHHHEPHLDLKWPQLDLEKKVDTVMMKKEALEGAKKFMLPKLEHHEPADHHHSSHQDFKWPKLDLEKKMETVLMKKEALEEMKKLMLSKFELPKFETIEMTDEEVEEMKKKFELPKFHLPKIEKGPVKEIPVHVYQLPPLPKMDLPKMDHFKELPLVMYEMPPLPELKPPKFPEIRIEKYILPKMEELKLEAPKEIPLVMYEFPKPDIDLPKIKPIKEIPIFMYELPPLPKMKLAELPKFKMPDVKVVKKKLPPMADIKHDMPKFDFKFPEIKIVKYQVPKDKLFELPKVQVPEIKFVKYEMPPIEKTKLPEFKVPEMKLPKFKVPELKIPELKPLDLPKFPYPMLMQPMHYMYAPPMGVPMMYPYPLPGPHDGHHGFKPYFGELGAKLLGAKGGIIKDGETDDVVGIIEDHFGDLYQQDFLKHLGHELHHNPGGSQVLVATGNDVILNGDEDVSQVFLEDGHSGIALQSHSPWGHFYPHLDIQGSDKESWLEALKELELDLSSEKENLERRDSVLSGEL